MLTSYCAARYELCVEFCFDIHEDRQDMVMPITSICEEFNMIMCTFERKLGSDVVRLIIRFLELKRVSAGFINTVLVIKTFTIRCLFDHPYCRHRSVKKKIHHYHLCSEE